MAADGQIVTIIHKVDDAKALKIVQDLAEAADLDQTEVSIELFQNNFQPLATVGVDSLRIGDDLPPGSSLGLM